MPSPINEGAKPTSNDSNEEMTMVDVSDAPVEEPIIETPKEEQPINEGENVPMNDYGPVEESMDIEATAASVEEETMDDVSSTDAETAKKEEDSTPAKVQEQQAPNAVKELGEDDSVEVEKEPEIEAPLVAESTSDISMETETDSVDWKELKKLGEAFDVAMDKLQERISAAILAMRTDEHEKAQSTFTEEKQKKSNAIYASLSDSAKETYHALIQYGSKFDLSSANASSSKSISETRRARLISTGKKIWMTIRNNPELLGDNISKETDNGGGDYLAFEGKKYQAVAGGYARAVAAQLVCLDYIDTRCKPGSPPSLSVWDGDENKPSVKELVFGLKVFSRAGKSVLTHSRSDPQAAHNSFSLAVSCYNMINDRAATDDEAAEEIKGLLDDAFDAFSLIPNAAAQFAEQSEKNSNEAVNNWPSLVIEHLKQAKKLLDDFCNLDSNGSRLTVSRAAILQRYLPSLARLCYKHGSQLVKIDECEHARNALHIALDTTNSSLNEVRAAIKKENDPLNDLSSRKAKGLQLQVLHNLEADLVVVIEAFYVLSNIFQSEGQHDKAIQCLDMIEKYMEEQKDRDDELYATAMSKVDSDLFSEGAITASAIEGPKKQDKLDIKARASTVRANAKKRHSQEKATLAFCRLMIYDKMRPCPSPEQELMIDKLIHELADLSKSTHCSSLNQNVFGISCYGGKSVDEDHIFSLALSAACSIHVRRMLRTPPLQSDHETDDPYSVILKRIPKSDTRYCYVLLNRLNALLSVRFQMDNNRLDETILQLASEYVETIKPLFGQSPSTNDSTLFSDSSKSNLHEKTKAHFARGLSLYHSSNANSSCVEYADMLESIILADGSSHDGSDASSELGEVIAIKAYSLSMTGQSGKAYKAAQDAWKMVKNIDTLVNLFHCSLRHEIKHSTCDTLLELDTAINDLSMNGYSCDEIVAAFPRLSNSCVDSGKGVGETVLLGLQERWVKMLVASKTLHHVLQGNSEEDNKVLHELGGHSVLEVLRAYLENFEHVATIEKDKDQQKAFIELGLGFLVSFVREPQSQKSHTCCSRKKKGEEPEFVLLWDDDTVKKLVGSRTDCVWVAEQLWNLSNKFMMSFRTTNGDGRKFSSQLFAGAHDFCLLSEEEQGAALSKGFLDIDNESDRLVTPVFKMDQERNCCDISSEFSGQCLLLSAATAVDFVANSSNKLDTNVKIMLRRSLQRLACAQDEVLLNSEDEAQKKDVTKMIVLLTLRCLLGIGDDSLAHAVLVTGGLETALLELFNDEAYAPADQLGGILPNVYLVACGAEEKSMSTFGSILLRSCASYMSQIGKFALQVDDRFSLTLAEIQRKVIQSASTTKDLVRVYCGIDSLVKKHKGTDSFYSKDDLDWFAIEAYNQGVSLSLLGDHENAGELFASALNMIPQCSNEVKNHTASMKAALSNSLSKHSSIGNSFNAVAYQVGL